MYSECYSDLSVGECINNVYVRCGIKIEKLTKDAKFCKTCPEKNGLCKSVNSIGSGLGL